MLGSSRDRSQGARMDLPGSSYLITLAVVSTTYVGFSALLVGCVKRRGVSLTSYDAYFTQTFIQLGLHRHGERADAFAGRALGLVAERRVARLQRDRGAFPFCRSSRGCPLGDARRLACLFPYLVKILISIQAATAGMLLAVSAVVPSRAGRGDLRDGGDHRARLVRRRVCVRARTDSPGDRRSATREKRARHATDSVVIHGLAGRRIQRRPRLLPRALLPMIRQSGALRLLDRDHHARHETHPRHDVRLEILVDGLRIEPALRREQRPRRSRARCCRR